jgi:thioredoxin reductase
MPKDERYDVVIVGGGPNGIGTAAYLAKSGLSLCVLEERTNHPQRDETPRIELYPELDVHAPNSKLAVISEAGKRLRDFAVETNGQALVEPIRMIPGHEHLLGAISRCGETD